MVIRSISLITADARGQVAIGAFNWSGQPAVYIFLSLLAFLTVAVLYMWWKKLILGITMITVCSKYRIVIIVCKLVCNSWTVSLDAKVPHQTWLLDSCAFLFWESLHFFYATKKHEHIHFFMLPKNMNIFNAKYIFNLKLWFRLCQCEWNSIPENPHNRSESKTEYLMSLMSWKIKIDSSEASKWIYVLQVPWNIIPVLGSIVLVAPQSCSRCLDIGWMLVGLGWVWFPGLDSVYILDWLWTLWDYKHSL